LPFLLIEDCKLISTDESKVVDTSFDSYSKHLLNFPNLGFALDLSRAPAPVGFKEKMSTAIAQALADMAALEKGAIANPDEKEWSDIIGYAHLS
jgi:hypothetical protein